MKDALGHGSDTHSSGIQQLPVAAAKDPRGGVARAAMLASYAARNEANQPASAAYYRGAAHHAAGGLLSENPGHVNPALAKEWDRGFKIEQKSQRRDATNAAKTLNRPTKVRR